MTSDQRHAKDLEYHNDLLKRYLEWLSDAPETFEDWTIRKNVKWYDEKFGKIVMYCAACGYPLESNPEENFHITNVGGVCRLCHFMHTLVAGRAWFVDAQREYNLAKPKKREIGDR